jgi:PEP-CTERM motif
MRASIKQLAAIAIATAIAHPAAAVSLGEIDNFSASAEGWFTGGGPMGVPLTFAPVSPNGGPGGIGDAYMELESTGASGPGSRLVVINADQWTGNYIAAGITAIEMDVRNFGSSDLTLRLLFEDPAGAPPENMAVTTVGKSLPAGSGWTHVTFSISPGDLTAINGDVTAALSGTTFFRLFHNVPAAFGPVTGPDAIAATLGVDNISAVPEPAALASMLAGLGLIGVHAWIRRRRNVA